MTRGKRAPEDPHDGGMVENASLPRFRATLQPPLLAMVASLGTTDCRAETSPKRSMYQTDNSFHVNAIFSEAGARILVSYVVVQCAIQIFIYYLMD